MRSIQIYIRKWTHFSDFCKNFQGKFFFEDQYQFFTIKCTYREYPAYQDQRKRHISASENDRLILKTVPKRVFAPILLSMNLILMRPILYRSFTSKLLIVDMQKFASWMFAQKIFILLLYLDELSYNAGISNES